MSIPRETGRISATCDAPQCETLDLGLEGFSECPQVGPSTCEFAVPFGYGFLCRHPGTGKSRAAGRTENPAGHAEIEQQRA